MSTLLHKDRLEGVNPLLSHCLVQAIESWDDPAVWTVSDGLRSLSQQQRFVRDGRSRTMHSLHLEGRAVDVYRLLHDGRVIDLQLRSYALLYVRVLREWSGVRVAGRSIVWGGLWKLADYGHFELH